MGKIDDIELVESRYNLTDKHQVVAHDKDADDAACRTKGHCCEIPGSNRKDNHKRYNQPKCDLTVPKILGKRTVDHRHECLIFSRWMTGKTSNELPGGKEHYNDIEQGTQFGHRPQGLLQLSRSSSSR